MTPPTAREVCSRLHLATDSPEAEYVHGVVSAVGPDPLPVDEFLAIGLLMFLQACDYEIGGFSTVNHPIAGSVGFDARLVAAIFAGLDAGAGRLRVRRAWLTNDAKNEVVEYWRSRVAGQGARILE